MGTLIAERQGAVLSLTLGNPAKANALDLAMLAALDAQCAAVEADESVRLVVLKGRAGGVFSSGADIAEWATMSAEQFATEWIAYGNTVFRRFERLRCPTMALIEGLCFGGGLELALCCDLRIGTPAARLRFPEVSIGAIPGWEGGPRLARIAGRGRALEAVLLAQELDADKAASWGLLNEVWAADELTHRLDALSTRLCTVSPQAAALAKRLIVAAPADQADSETAHREAARRIKSSRDAAIGIQAFFAKKPPQF